MSVTDPTATRPIDPGPGGPASGPDPRAGWTLWASTLLTPVIATVGLWATSAVAASADDAVLGDAYLAWWPLYYVMEAAPLWLGALVVGFAALALHRASVRHEWARGTAFTTAALGHVTITLCALWVTFVEVPKWVWTDGFPLTWGSWLTAMLALTASVVPVALVIGRSGLPRAARWVALAALALYVVAVGIAIPTMEPSQPQTGEEVDVVDTWTPPPAPIPTAGSPATTPLPYGAPRPAAPEEPICPDAALDRLDALGAALVDVVTLSPGEPEGGAWDGWCEDMRTNEVTGRAPDVVSTDVVAALERAGYRDVSLVEAEGESTIEAWDPAGGLARVTIWGESTGATATTVVTLSVTVAP